MKSVLTQKIKMEEWTNLEHDDPTICIHDSQWVLSRWHTIY